MESEKVKEIKKVLEEGQFNTINHHQHEGKPIKISFADILTYINELEKENEKLLDSVETVQNDRCVFKCELTKKHLKQFAERLKEKLFDLGNIVNENDIDETLKECINGKE